MAERKTIRLGNVIRTNVSTYSEKEGWAFVNYLDTGNITQDTISEIQRINIGTDKLPSRARRKVQIGNIIYSTVRPNQLHYGFITSQPDNFLVSTGFAVIDVNENKAVPKYIYYFLTHRDVTERLQAIAEQSTSAYPSIKPSDIEDLTIDLPPIEEQRKIVGLLKMLDGKIKQNTEINNNLLLQAQAVFSKYYDASIDKQSFTSLIRVLGGGTPKTGNLEYWNGAIPFFTPKDVGEPYTFHTEKNLTEAGLNNCNSRLYPINTSFVTARGTVGKVSLAGKPMAMNQSCYALASETIDPILVYFYVLKAVSSLKHKASGAVFDAIVTRDFDTEVINVLNSDDSKAVLEVIAPMMNAIHSNTVENIRLSSLRDTLLPRLMSGELDVSDIEL